MRLRAVVDSKPESLFVALPLLYGLKRRHQPWLFDINFLRRQGIDEEHLPQLLEHGQNLLNTLTWIGDVDPDATFPKLFRRFDFHYGTPLVWFRQLTNRTRYHGPESGLGNCQFDEFMAADRAYRDGNLPMLAAILYRPLKAGHRTPLDLKECQARAVLFAALEPALLERIRFAFGCTMLNLQRIFKHVFPKSEESTADKNKKPGTWLDVAIGMAKFDVTKIRDIEQINLYLALKVLNEQIKQAEAMESNLAKMKAQSHV